MNRKRELQKYSLHTFESLDLTAKDTTQAKMLTRELEAEVARVFTDDGIPGVQDLVDQLNSLGHNFAPKKSSPGWTSYYESTNDGARAFFIHVEGGDSQSVMVLYHETIETTVARRRAAMSPKARAQTDTEEEFARRGLALNTWDQAYRSLKPNDRLIACLHELEGGVNNGGFSTYLANTEGARVGDAAKFLEEIGAKKTADIVRDVIALFPGRFGPAFRSSADVLIESKREALEQLSNRFCASRENIAVLAMRHIAGLTPKAPKRRRAAE